MSMILIALLLGVRAYQGGGDEPIESKDAAREDYVGGSDNRADTNAAHISLGLAASSPRLRSRRRDVAHIFIPVCVGAFLLVFLAGTACWLWWQVREAKALLAEPLGKESDTAVGSEEVEQFHYFRVAGEARLVPKLEDSCGNSAILSRRRSHDGTMSQMDFDPEKRLSLRRHSDTPPVSPNASTAAPDSAATDISEFSL